MELAAQFDSTRETSPDPSVFGDGQWHTHSVCGLKQLLDKVDSGAWPFLVGGVTCLVNSDNERDPYLLNNESVCCSHTVSDKQYLLRGIGDLS